MIRMKYYKIAVAARQKLPESSLTYSSYLNLKPGQIVNIELRSKNALGLVLNETTKPEYDTKQIESVTELTLPQKTADFYAKLQEFYPHKSGALLQNFIPSYVLKIEPERLEALQPLKEPGHLPVLTKDQ